MKRFIKCLKLRKPAWFSNNLIMNNLFFYFNCNFSNNLITDDASSPNMWDGSECFRLGRNSVPLYFAELLSVQPHLIDFQE